METARIAGMSGRAPSTVCTAPAPCLSGLAREVPTPLAMLDMLDMLDMLTAPSIKSNFRAFDLVVRRLLAEAAQVGNHAQAGRPTGFQSAEAHFSVHNRFLPAHPQEPSCTTSSELLAPI
jgi:hypothetical protein